MIFGGYATYSLARVFPGLGNLRELAVLARVECRIANVRQFILLLLLLFGMTVANEAFTWVRAFRLVQWQDCDCVYPYGPWAAFSFIVLASLVFLHLLQWIACVRLQRRASELSG